MNNTMKSLLPRSLPLPWYRRIAPRLHSREINGRYDTDQPYMVRYTLLNLRLIKVYLHQILRSDDTPDFHDHPWAFFHVILEGGYIEEMAEGSAQSQTYRFIFGHPRRKGYWAVHKAVYQHRVELFQDSRGNPVEAWTLVIVGPKVRRWGFVDRVKGCWVHWKKYVSGERC